MSKFGGGIGAPSKEERLKEAADIHLRLGQIQRYCELMVELGQVCVRSGSVVSRVAGTGSDSSLVSLSVGESLVCCSRSLHEVLAETHAEVNPFRF